MFASMGYWLAWFLAAFGAFFGFLAYKEPKKKGLITARNILILFCFLYLALSHFSAYAGLAYAVEQTYIAPCENVVANSTYSGNTTQYAYVDSCEGNIVPKGAARLFGMYGYLLYLDLLVITLGMMFLLIRKVFLEW